jgi:rubrerythrin
MENVDAQYGQAYEGMGSRLERSEMEKLYQGELTGEAFYMLIADLLENEQAAELLRRNGREELAHARRLAKAMSILDGQEWTPPQEFAEAEPVVAPKKLSWKFFNGVYQGELAGDASYEKWASAETNEEVAKLLRLNGREETIHANRVAEVIQLLGLTEG